MRTGLFVGLHTVGHTFNNIFEINRTGNLRENHSIERIPVSDDVAFLHLIAMLEVKFCTVRNVGREESHRRLFVNNLHLC